MGYVGSFLLVLPPLHPVYPTGFSHLFFSFKIPTNVRHTTCYISRTVNCTHVSCEWVGIGLPDRNCITCCVGVLTFINYFKISLHRNSLPVVNVLSCTRLSVCLAIRFHCSTRNWKRIVRPLHWNSSSNECEKLKTTTNKITNRCQLLERGWERKQYMQSRERTRDKFSQYLNYLHIHFILHCEKCNNCSMPRQKCKQWCGWCQVSEVAEARPRFGKNKTLKAGDYPT